MRSSRIPMATALRVACASLATAAAIGASAAVGPEACKACHGANGISASPTIPNLAGQKRDYLVKQLQAFRSGERKNELMAAIASQLDDTQMRTLATYWSGLPAAGIAASGPAASPVGDSLTAIRSRTPFPAGFPAGFLLYDSESSPQTQEIVQRYANEIAVAAARAGRPLPEGSVIVSVTSAALRDAQNLERAGEPKSYAVMASRAGWGEAVPELLRNGDWDYALFGADRQRRDSLNQAPCLACHKPLAASSYVFTLKALASRAGR